MIYNTGIDIGFNFPSTPINLLLNNATKKNNNFFNILMNFSISVNDTCGSYFILFYYNPSIVHVYLFICKL